MGESSIPEGLTSRARRGRVGLIARLVLSLVVLAVVLLSVDTGKVAEGFRGLAPWAWFLALAVFLSLQALSALKWRWFLRLSGADLAAGVAVRCQAAGLFANLCLPSLIGGDVLRLGSALPTTAPRERAALVLGSLVDRVADMLALLALAIFGLLATDVGAELVGGTLVAIPATLAVLGGGVGLGLLLLRFQLLRRPLRRQPRRLIQLARALRALRRQPGGACAAWACCVLLQGGFVLVNVVVGTSLGLDLALGTWFLLWPLAKLAAMLPVSFGGLGVREAAFAALLAPLGLQELAVVQSLIWQSVLIVGGLLAGAYWLRGSAR